MKTKEYFAGTIVLRDKVIVGDPCYPEIENVAVLNNVLEGTYNCFVKKGDVDGQRVMSIEVKHHQYQHLANEPFYIIGGGFGVDSGQAGIYDYGYHQEYHQFEGWVLKNEGSKEQAWYNRIGVLTQNLEKIRVVKKPNKEGWYVLHGEGEGKEFTCSYADQAERGKDGYTYDEVWKDLTASKLAERLGYTIYKAI